MLLVRLLAFVALLVASAAFAQDSTPSKGQLQSTRCVTPDGTAFESCGGVGGTGGTAEADNSAFTGGTTFVTPIGALYDTTPPAITDGSIGAPMMDASRRLRIICEGGCGGASPFEDEDAFTVGTTSINVTGYVVDETLPDSAPENSAAAPRMSPNRVPYSILRDAAGNERGANVTAGNALQVDGSAVTQPVSGTVTVADGGGSLTVDGTTFDGILRDGAGDTTQANVSGGRLHVDGSGVTQPVSAASLPLPTGAATAANQDGIIRDGTGDTTQANVSSGRLHVDGSGVTQPTDPTDDDTRVLGRVKLHDGTDTALVSGTGSLQVTCDNCGGASPFEDLDAFTAGTSSVQNIGGVFNDGLADVTSGQAAAPRITKDRGLHVNLRDNDGAEVGVSAAPLRVDPTGTTTQPISAASLPLPTGAATAANQDGIVRDGTGDTTQANVSGGRLHVDGSGVTQPISAASLPLPTGAATAANQDGIVRDGTGDTTQANVSSGRLHVDGSGVTQPVNLAQVAGSAPGATNPLPTRASDGSAFIDPREIEGQNNGRPIYCGSTAFLNMSTATTTQIVALSGGTHIYVCSYALMAGGTANVKLVSGTGTDCVTSPADVTPNYPLVAQAGVNRTAGGGNIVTRTNDAGDALCATSSAAVTVVVEVSYTQF